MSSLFDQETARPARGTPHDRRARSPRSVRAALAVERFRHRCLSASRIMASCSRPSVMTVASDREQVHCVAVCAVEWQRMPRPPRRARVVAWNGTDVPPEVRELDPNRHIVEPFDDGAPPLSPEEQAGIEAALESYRECRVVDAKRAREIIGAVFG